MKPSLTCQNLTIGYSAGNPILSNIDIELQGGEFNCLLGANGAGKSTLIRTLCGFQKNIGGEVKVNSHKLNRVLDVAKNVSVVLTDPINSGNLSVYELVALGRYPHTNWIMSLNESDKHTIHEALHLVGIVHLSDRNIHELSDGQLQKCQIARALAQKCPIMILDEPTTHLDLNNRVEIMRLLRTLAHKENKLILVATHELDLALQMADNFLVISKDGIEKGVPEDLVLSGVLDKVFEMKGFDLKSGRTIFEPEEKLTINVSGTGYPLLWTKNAFERTGYSVISGQADIQILVALGKGNEINWVVENQHVKEQFQSIAGMLDYIRKI